MSGVDNEAVRHDVGGWISGPSGDTRPAPAGPYGTRAQAFAMPAVRAAYDAAHAASRRGVLAERNHRMLCEALTAAGVELGDYDHRIVQWLAGWEPEVCAVIAGLIERASAAGQGGAS